MKAEHVGRALVEPLENRRMMSLTPSPAIYTFAVTSADFSGQVDVFSGIPAADVSSLTAVIHWGDGSKSIGTIVPTATAGMYAIDGSHTYGPMQSVPPVSSGGPRQGSIPCKITLWQNYNSVGMQLESSGFAVGQFNLPGSPGITTQQSQIATNTFTGMLGRFDIPLLPNSGIREATIQWGDGQTSAGIVQDDPHGGSDVFGQHTYATTGFYEVNVDAFDGSGPPAPGQVVAPLEVDVIHFITAVSDPGNIVMPGIRGNPLPFNTTTMISDSAISGTNKLLDAMP